MGQWGKFRVKNATFVYIAFWFSFFFFVFCIFLSNFFFLSFPVLFFVKEKKILQQNFNQSEIGIGNKKLSVELYAEQEFIANFFVGITSYPNFNGIATVGVTF